MNVSNFVYINSGDSSSSSDTSSTSNKENLEGSVDTREGNLSDLSEGRPAEQQEETSEEATIVAVEPNSDNNQAGASGELAQNILEVFGKRLEPEIQLGPAIHKDISIRWMEICNKGLPKEEQTVIMKKYPVPENCKGINPPILNAEVKASLPEGAINRDARMVSKQKKLASCLSALGGAISSLLIDKGPNNLTVLESLCDAGRLLVDLQHENR